MGYDDSLILNKHSNRKEYTAFNGMFFCFSKTKQGGSLFEAQCCVSVAKDIAWD